MLGLCECDEVSETVRDLRAVYCGVVTLNQYATQLASQFKTSDKPLRPLHKLTHASKTVTRTDIDKRGIRTKLVEFELAAFLAIPGQ